jgi:hypothetical protein
MIAEETEKLCARCRDPIKGVADRCVKCLHADWLDGILLRMGEILRDHPSIGLEFCLDAKTRIRHIALAGIRPRVGFCGAKISAGPKSRTALPADAPPPAGACTFCLDKLAACK